MKQCNLILLVIGALTLNIMAAGCTPPVYVAPAVHAPIFTNAGQVRVAGHVGSNGVDGQVAASVADGVAVLASGSFDKAGEDLESHEYGEIGAGWYGPVSHWGVLGIFGGLGFGRSSGDNTEDEGEFADQILQARGTYQRPFVQLQLGAASKYAEFAYVMRFAYMMYRYEEINGESASARSDALFIEPGIVGRIGSENIKLEAQFAWIHRPSDTEQVGYLSYDDFHVSLGLHVQLGAPGKKVRR